MKYKFEEHMKLWICFDHVNRTTLLCEVSQAIPLIQEGTLQKSRHWLLQRVVHILKAI